MCEWWKYTTFTELLLIPKFNFSFAINDHDINIKICYQIVLSTINCIYSYYYRFTKMLFNVCMYIEVKMDKKHKVKKKENLNSN